jgi:BirA family biotin operon repressor/biotin-[acetyl-CoA-carboxylase] ligase
MLIPPLLSAEIKEYLYEVELPSRLTTGCGDDAEEIIRYGSFVGSEIESHIRLDRAMDKGRFHIDSQEEHGRSVNNGRLILAGSLTGSKGRFTREWHAPQGGLWGCLVHATTLTPQSSMLLSLALGVAACEAIRQVGVGNAHIRWVNDVVVDSAKIAGFLVESHTGPKWSEVFHLIGFGVNVNNCDFPSDLENIATSVQKNLGEEIDLRSFSLDFIAKLAWNIGLLYFVEARNPQWHNGYKSFVHPIIDRWQELSDSLGKKVIYGYDVLTQPQYVAQVIGIAEDGGLQMILEDGTQITEHSGEIRYVTSS